MSHALEFYIDGAWVEPTGMAALAVIDPSTEEVYAEIALGTSADVDKAVPDVDLETAVTKGVQGCFGNSDQSCNAPTRMSVLADRRARRRRLQGRLGGCPDDPARPRGQLGPVRQDSKLDQDRHQGRGAAGRRRSRPPGRG